MCTIVQVCLIVTSNIQRMNRPPVETQVTQNEDRVLCVNVFLNAQAEKEGKPLYQYTIRDPIHQQQIDDEDL